MPTRRKFRLTSRRQRWAANRKNPGQFVAKPLRPNAGIESAYALALRRQVTAMREVVEREVAALYGVAATDHAMDARPRTTAAAARILSNALYNRFLRHFARIAPNLASRYMGRVDRSSKAQLHSTIQELSGGLSLKMPDLTGDVLQAFRASTEANVALIKSIPDRYFIDIQGAILRNVQQGGTGASGLLDELRRMGQVAERRANLIAVDQVRKATTAINDARLKRLGVRKFRWVHSGGGKEPRPLHQRMDGQTYDLDNPPVIDEKTGERGLPGQLINCKCAMAPVVDFGE